MEGQKQMSFTFEIDNFSDKEASIFSPKFSSGGCQWVVKVYPKGKVIDDHLSLFLCVANPETLRLGWKRRASYSFFLVNQSGKELFKLNGWGIAKAMPLKKLQEKGFLEKNKLIVKVEVKVVEVVDQGGVTGNETLDVKGFQVPYSQTLNKPPRNISETELSNARSELFGLTEAGFKLDWLKTKFDAISLARKKTNAADGFRVQELEELIKNLKDEVFMLEPKGELDKEFGKYDAKLLSQISAKVLLLEQTVSDFKDELSDLKDELNKEKDKSDTCAAKVLSLEQMVLNLTAELNKEKSVVCSWEVLDYADAHNEK
ncbi:unnamed protein product [Microthlaspi erraticum]|uniref:MATH domain-containing protein n=1 Tax=Microthlaspi erraticum TaxID=1685480 RepID=A0A6D2IKR4_9BRAS|nr:unnamed protein product [Microthlaspi erraticum]